VVFFFLLIHSNKFVLETIPYVESRARENVLNCGEHEQGNLLLPFAAQKANFEVFEIYCELWHFQLFLLISIFASW
jgi:hypothetical protein